MKTSIIENKKIAIIGGGPVGLTTARILQINGADVTVYERDINAQARTSGGTLDIHSDSGQYAIQKAGLMDKFYKYARPTGEKMADMDGNITSDEMPNETNAFSRPEIDRNDLRKIMLDNLSEDTVVWDSQLINLEKTKNQYILEFKNGKTATADFVIVANGGRSNARKFVSDQEPQLSGTYIIQGEIVNPDKDYPEFKPKFGNGNVMAMGEQKMFYTHTMRDGSIHFGVSFKADEHWISNHGINFEDDKEVIAFLQYSSPVVEAIKACNCIRKFNNELYGHNTDVIGFEKSLLPFLQPHHTHALILGTGGASAAVQWVLQKLNIQFQVVSINGNYNLNYEKKNRKFTKIQKKSNLNNVIF